MRLKWIGPIAALLAIVGLAHGQDSVTLGPPTARVPSTNGIRPNLGVAPYTVYQPYGQPPPPFADGNPVVPDGPNVAPPWRQPPIEQPCFRVKGWLTGDFLLWFLPSQHLPANLVTETAAPGSAVVIGGSSGYGLSFGFRIDAGIWLDPEERRGGQTLFNQIIRDYKTVTPAGTVFLQTTNPAGAALPFAATGLGYQTWSQFNSTDGNSLFRLGCTRSTKWYGILGTKVINIEEDVSLSYAAAGLGATSVLDEFHTRNSYWGGQIGLLMKYDADRLSFDLTAKVALGGNYSNITVFGRNNGPVNSQVFTNAANIGYYESTAFAVVPEVLGNVSYSLTQRLSIRAGYTFIAIPRVARPGDQIVQVTSFPAIPPTQPVMPYTRTTFVVHGLNFGACLKY